MKAISCSAAFPTVSASLADMAWNKKSKSLQIYFNLTKPFKLPKLHDLDKLEFTRINDYHIY